MLSTFHKLTLVIALICLSTTSLAKEAVHPQQQRLIADLKLMLTQDIDAFVVAEAVGTEKFIQFYSETQGLFIDLPAVALTVEENKRADAFFRKNDVPQVVEEATDPDTDEGFSLIVWRQAFDKDQAAEVVDLSLSAMIEIYQLEPDFELKTYKGWE